MRPAGQIKLASKIISGGARRTAAAAFVEILAEIGLKSVREVMRPSSPSHPNWRLVGYILLGGVLAGVSLLFFPQKFAVPVWLQIANIVVSPIIVGAAWCGLGDGERREASGQFFFISFGLVSLLRWFLRWCGLGLQGSGTATEGVDDRDNSGWIGGDASRSISALVSWETVSFSLPVLLSWRWI
jgi:hypothetical protein